MTEEFGSRDGSAGRGGSPDHDVALPAVATARPRPLRIVRVANFVMPRSGGLRSTPVVVNVASALPEVVGAAGVAAEGTGIAFAEGVLELLAQPESQRRAAARARAERFGWQAAVEAFLRAHDAPVQLAAAAL